MTTPPPPSQGNIVNDVGQTNASVVILLESTHTDELHNGYPACGLAGRNLSCAILGRTDIPLTLPIKFPQISLALGIPDLSHIAVLNISQQPLQPSAYKDYPSLSPSNITTLYELKRYLERVSRAGKIDLENPHEQVQKQIYKNFSSRFHSHWNQAKLIVPCGKFAHYFLSWYLNETQGPPSAILRGLEHPAKRKSKWAQLNPTDEKYQSLRKLATPASVDELVREVRQTN